MTGPIYLLIEPQPHAHKHFMDLAGEASVLLLEPLLLDPEAKSVGAVFALAKLVFLARMREYDPFKSPEDAVRIFGADEISTDVFDRWWTIRHVEYEFSFDEMVKAYLAPVSAKVTTHGDADLAGMVDHWLRKSAS